MLVSFVPSNKETFHREKKADKLARAKKPRSQEVKQARRQLQESRILDPIFGAWEGKQHKEDGFRRIFHGEK